MKVVTTNLLNRFWKNGIKPIMEGVAKKIDTSKIVQYNRRWIFNGRQDGVGSYY